MRGSVPRTQMNRNRKSHILATNHSTGQYPVLNMPSLMVDSGHGARRPPSNRVVAIAETRISLMYPARKNIAHFTAEYSDMKPETSSPSASGRANGARCVSPIIEITKITNAGNSATDHHSCCCESTICEVDIEPATMNTETSDRLKASSYEITCAAERTAPSSGRSEEHTSELQSRGHLVCR